MKDRHLDINFYRFLKHKKGAVAIEFVFMLILLVFIFAFMADLVVVRSSMGKLDNTSYSLASLLRERTQLYQGNENLDLTQVNNRDVDNFKRIAARMVYGDEQRVKDISVVLESVRFVGNDETEDHNIVGDVQHCKPANNLMTSPNDVMPSNNGASLAKIVSPRSEQHNGRKIPVYQVTVCMPTASLFKAIVLGEKEQSGSQLRSSSITISR